MDNVKWYKDDLSYKLENETPKLLSKRDEGDVYLYESAGLVVKEVKYTQFGYICNECVEREYNVGVLVNSYNNKHLVKTLGYYEKVDKNNIRGSYVVTKYIKGVPLSQKDFDAKLLMRIWNIIYGLQKEMKFTHYDLHFDNIIIGPNNDITIIDLSRSYIDGILTSYVDTAWTDSAVTPGIFDPLFDLAYFLGEIVMRYPELANDYLFDLLERNGFESCENVRVGYPITDDGYMMGDLIRDNKMWACDYGGIYSMLEVNRQFGHFKLKYNKKAISKNDEEMMDLANSLTVPDEYIEKYVKLLGEAVVHDKLIAMNNRIDNGDEFYIAGLNYLLMIDNL